MHIDPAGVFPIAEYIWNNISVIDEYVSKKGTNLTDEDKEIVLGWKRFVRGKFIVERHLKKGSVFIKADDCRVYLVSGLASTWEEMLRFRRLPAIIETTLLPFKEVIISDGLIMMSNISFGRGAAQDFKEAYMTAKGKGKIHKTL